MLWFERVCILGVRIGPVHLCELSTGPRPAIAVMGGFAFFGWRVVLAGSHEWSGCGSFISFANLNGVFCATDVPISVSNSNSAAAERK